MNTKEVTEALSILGWSSNTDEVGEKFAHLHLPDRTIQIIYGVRNFTDDQQLEANLSLSTDTFSKVCAIISDNISDYTPLIRSWKGLRIKVPKIKENHVKRISDKAFCWAKDQDLDEAIEAHASLPTDAPGARPIWHLSALVLSKNIQLLQFYKTSFANGDRLGFVNYVNEDYIDRAMGLVKDFRP